MHEHEYAEYQAIQTVPSEPVLTIEDFAGPDRTLIYGYTCDRDTVHVYLTDGELHYVLSGGAAGQRGGILRYEHGTSLPAELLRPNKRAYPARTDLTAALRMAQLGFELSFVGFNADERQHITDGFYGLVADRFQAA